MADTHISIAAAQGMLDGLTDRLDAGAAAGRVEIYDSTKPAAGPDEAIVAQVLLSSHTLSDPAFGAAVDSNPNATATANAVADDTDANATGTATWFRAFDSNDVAVIDGDVSESGGGGDMIIDNANIQSGATVSISSWTITQPEA